MLELLEDEQNEKKVRKDARWKRSVKVDRRCNATMWPNKKFDENEAC